MVINAYEQIGQFISISDAKTHDKRFLEQLNIKAYSLVVFDRAYNHYLQFAKWTNESVFFVTRKKSNAKYQVIETMYTSRLKDKEHGVHMDQKIELTYKEEKKEKEEKNKAIKEKILQLRLVTYYDEKGRKYEFISNSFEELTAEEIAASYKKRWDIELLFKKLKQNFQLHYFYGENETAIRTQIWCTLIAQLLITVIQKQQTPTKAFSTVACILRIHLISMLDLVQTVKAETRCYRKKNPLRGQKNLFGEIEPEELPKRKKITTPKNVGGQFSKQQNSTITNTDNQLVNKS
jgi:IS4 transposase